MSLRTCKDQGQHRYHNVTSASG